VAAAGGGSLALGEQAASRRSPALRSGGAELNRSNRMLSHILEPKCPRGPEAPPRTYLATKRHSTGEVGAQLLGGGSGAAGSGFGAPLRASPNNLSQRQASHSTNGTSTANRNHSAASSRTALTWTTTGSPRTNNSFSSGAANNNYNCTTNNNNNNLNTPAGAHQSQGNASENNNNNNNEIETIMSDGVNSPEQSGTGTTRQPEAPGGLGQANEDLDGDLQPAKLGAGSVWGETQIAECKLGQIRRRSPERPRATSGPEGAQLVSVGPQLVCGGSKLVSGEPQLVSGRPQRHSLESIERTNMKLNVNNNNNNNNTSENVNEPATSGALCSPTALGRPEDNGRQMSSRLVGGPGGVVVSLEERQVGGAQGQPASGTQARAGPQLRRAIRGPESVLRRGDLGAGSELGASSTEQKRRPRRTSGGRAAASQCCAAGQCCGARRPAAVGRRLGQGGEQGQSPAQCCGHLRRAAKSGAPICNWSPAEKLREAAADEEGRPARRLEAPQTMVGRQRGRHCAGAAGELGASPAGDRAASGSPRSRLGGAAVAETGGQSEGTRAGRRRSSASREGRQQQQCGGHGCVGAANLGPEAEMVGGEHGRRRRRVVSCGSGATEQPERRRRRHRCGRAGSVSAGAEGEPREELQLEGARRGRARRQLEASAGDAGAAQVRQCRRPRGRHSRPAGELKLEAAACQVHWAPDGEGEPAGEPLGEAKERGASGARGEEHDNSANSRTSRPSAGQLAGRNNGAQVPSEIGSRAEEAHEQLGANEPRLGDSPKEEAGQGGGPAQVPSPPEEQYQHQECSSSDYDDANLLFGSLDEEREQPRARRRARQRPAHLAPSGPLRALGAIAASGSSLAELAVRRLSATLQGGQPVERPQPAELDNKLEAGCLSSGHIGQWAAPLATNHSDSSSAPRLSLKVGPILGQTLKMDQRVALSLSQDTLLSPTGRGPGELQAAASRAGSLVEPGPLERADIDGAIETFGCRLRASVQDTHTSGLSLG